MSLVPPAVSPFRIRSASGEPFVHPSWERAASAATAALGRGASVALLGLPGTGKTFLLEHLADRLRSGGATVAVLRPPGWTGDGTSDITFVDEADSLPKTELRQLCERDPVVALAGLPPFASVVATLPRPIVTVMLEPLSAESVARFVAMRLRGLGLPATMFTPEAVWSVAAHSGGLMRLVVVLSGSAMFLAEQEGASQVTARHVEEATALRFDPEQADAPVPASAEPARIEPSPCPSPPLSPSPSSRRLSPVLVGVAAAVLAGIGLWAGLQPSGPASRAPRGAETDTRPPKEAAGATAAPDPAPDPTPAIAAPTPKLDAPVRPTRSLSDAAPPAPASVGDRVTVFRGPVMNVTMRQGGQLTLVIQRHEGQTVTIDFRASSGLIGTGQLTGTMTEDGHIDVDGRLMMGRNPFNCVLSAVARGDNLVGEASFTRVGGTSSARSSFNLAKRS